MLFCPVSVSACLPPITITLFFKSATHRGEVAAAVLLKNVSLKLLLNLDRSEVPVVDPGVAGVPAVVKKSAATGSFARNSVISTKAFAG